jgi:hypothetical protein
MKMVFSFDELGENIFPFPGGRGLRGGGDNW